MALPPGPLPRASPVPAIGNDRCMASRVALIGYGTGGAVFHAPLIDSVPVSG